MGINVTGTSFTPAASVRRYPPRSNIAAQTQKLLFTLVPSLPSPHQRAREAVCCRHLAVFWTYQTERNLTLSGRVVHSGRLGRVVAPVRLQKFSTSPASFGTSHSVKSSVGVRSGEKWRTLGTMRGKMTTVCARPALTCAHMPSHEDRSKQSYSLLDTIPWRNPRLSRPSLWSHM